MKHLIILLIVLTASRSYSQTNYYRYDSRTGTSEKVGYSEPASNSQLKFSEYIPPYDLNQYASVLAQRNQQYENHVTEIQNEINRTGQALYNLSRVDEDSYNKLSGKFNQYLKALSGTKLDYSDFDIYMKVKQDIYVYRQTADNLTNSAYTSSIKNTVQTNKEPEYDDITYQGTVGVYTCSPIVSQPHKDAPELFRLCDGQKITILYRVDRYYYCINYKQNKAYILRNWIKP
jgi:lipopolysaccharide export LptBFGC system permease protein LptF